MGHKNAPLLTVLIANYNYGRFIEEALASVFRQDYAPIELIVVDDGSTDDSVERIEQALSKADRLHRVEFVRLGKNVGKLGALNAVHEKMSGDYCLTLDADDRLEDKYISYCLDKLITARKADPDIAFIYTDCTLIDEAGAVMERGRSTAFDAELLQKFSYVPEPAIVLTEAYRQVIPFDPSIRIATKHHKWLRLVAKGWTGLHIAEPLFCYRMHKKNLSGIGERVGSELEKGEEGERILSGYWTTARV